jgi:hypothetical protein
MSMCQSWRSSEGDNRTGDCRRSEGASCVLGSLVVALGSSLSTWITQRHADHRDLLARKISLILSCRRQLREYGSLLFCLSPRSERVSKATQLRAR